MKRVVSCSALAFAFAIGCKGGGDSNSNDHGDATPGENTEAFPGGLAIASPTDYGDENESFARPSAPPAGTGYASSVENIEKILNGETATDCHFDPSLFLATETNANCYGPSISYEGHPDGTGGDGNLPGGDLGIWVSEDTTGHACAAAQLNTRMDGVSKRTEAGLTGFASMICAINVNGVTFPEDGSSVDILAEMNGLGMDGVTFETASIAVSADGSYTYDLDLTFEGTGPGGPGGPTTENVVVAHMEHTKGADDTVYNGKLYTSVNLTDNMGHCPGNVTNNQSLVYDRSSETVMGVQARSAVFCGHDADGFDADGLVDPAAKYDSGSNPDGWQGNFNMFTASFDPTDLGGDYSFGWQAGSMDNNTRVFNLHSDVSGATPQISAFFGFGVDVEDFDGNIGGFICNWAGPGNSHTLLDLVQRQVATLDATSGLFVVDSENISYAPSTDCDGAVNFDWDSDADGAVDDMDNTFTHDLYAAADGDADGVLDEIADSGFVAPVAPTP